MIIQILFSFTPRHQSNNSNRKKGKEMNQTMLKRRMSKQYQFKRVLEQDKTDCIINNLRGKKSSDILDKYCSEKDLLPIDIVDIAQNIGIGLGSANFEVLEKKHNFKKLSGVKDNILGALLVKDNNIQIIYDSSYRDLAKAKLTQEEKEKKLDCRQRFTIAHEIAHCCLHMQKGQRVHIEYRTDQTDKNNKKEISANTFAGELLIPTKMILDILNNVKGISISTLANIFAVSEHVMIARMNHLKELNLI